MLVWCPVEFLLYHNFFLVCRENRTKFIKEVSSDQTTLTYTQQKVFHFDAANSAAGLSEDDTICTVNLPLVVSLFVLSCVLFKTCMCTLVPMRLVIH